MPPGAERLFSERVLRLSRIPLVYAPPAGMPEVAPLPALKNGYMTFGCFSRTARINDARHRRLVQASSMRAGLPPRAQQQAVPRARRPRSLASLALRRMASRRDRIELVYTTPQPKTWEAYGDDRHRARSIPAQCRHDDDRGAVARRSRRVACDRPPVGRFGASILGSLAPRATGSPAMFSST